MNWRQSTIFQTLTKVSDKICQVIIDSGSCVNAVTSNMTKFELKPVPYRQPYKVSWVNSVSIDVEEDVFS